MAKLNAPDVKGLYYNARKVYPGEAVDILERDVKALMAVGWSASTPLAFVYVEPEAEEPETEESDEDQ